MMMKFLPPTQIDRILEKVSQQDTFDPKALLKSAESLREH
jgi:hypothetical protein